MDILVSKIEDIGHAFDEFKGKNASEIAEIKAELREFEKRAGRSNFGSGDRESLSADAREHKAAFRKFVVKGEEGGLSDLEVKALNTTSGAEGGYAVPEEIDRVIAETMRNFSGMRQLASVVSVGSNDFKKLISVHGAAASWVGETSSRPETNSPNLAEIAPPIGELYANPVATQRILRDPYTNKPYVHFYATKRVGGSLMDSNAIKFLATRT